MGVFEMKNFWGIVLALWVVRPVQAETAFEDRHLLEQVDLTLAVLSGVVALVVALIGVPVAWMNIRKTRATINKTELEAQKLRSELQSFGTTDASASEDGTRIEIVGDRNVISVVTDPRLSGPLLIVVDFVVAWIILTLLNYALRVLPLHLGILQSVLVGGVAAFLLIPILQDARKASKWLRETVEKDENGASTKID
ncbi:hypothetical protein [Ruegeria sp. Ofav3-42]|uniref:hypothetical protein n=1 Tax=Ruegeria sp. Ofav3-42 TaxID=2917759 RepID=UPI001EF4C4C1|nr:hypothetical protein [Ruegeria sp. Ofav3-42]MCG7521883.1 hypothetical protein [Ruegeria sp. Ofav3-42]